MSLTSQIDDLSHHSKFIIHRSPLTISRSAHIHHSPFTIYYFGTFIEYMIAANVSRCLSNLSPSVEIMTFNC